MTYAVALSSMYRRNISRRYIPRSRREARTTTRRPEAPRRGSGVRTPISVSGARGLKGLLVVPALADLFDELVAEGRQVVGPAARDESLVHVDLLVDPVAAGVADVSPEAGPRSQ